MERIVSLGLVERETGTGTENSDAHTQQHTHASTLPMLFLKPFRSSDRTQVNGSCPVVLCVYDGVTVRRTWAVFCGEYSMRVCAGVYRPACH